MYHDVDGYRGTEGLKAIKKEAVANMVGDYLFTDKKFISQLSAKHPNIFQKIWNEIKYTAKLARAGSDEAKKLLQVQKAFEEAYQEAGKIKKDPTSDGEVKYALANREDITPNTEQLVTNARAVTEMELVCKIAADKLLDSGRDIKEIYAENFFKWGENIHSDIFGDIAVKKSSIGSEFAHGNTAAKIAAIEAIPNVIQKGKIIDWFEKSKGLFRITVAAPIGIGEDRYYMGVMLQRDNQNQRLYIHDVILEKEAFEHPQDHLSTKGPRERNKNLSISSILQKALYVNPQYYDAVKNGDMKTAQKMVDEAAKAAGYTVKAYHGTDADTFTVFDKGKIGEASGLSILGDGFYFSDKKSVAAQYGKNVYTVYLKQQNPYSATVDDTYKLNAAKLDGDGYDGVTLPTGKGTVYMVLDPEQIKSADPVTYDDNGNVIPLSERFKAENDDIRYSLSNEDTLPVKQGNYRVTGEEIAYDEQLPMADSRTGTEAETPVAEAMTGEGDLLPMGKQLEARLRESQKANAEKDLEDKRALRDLQLAKFDSLIAEKEAELEAMPHKHSAAAKELRKEIDQLKKNRATSRTVNLKPQPQGVIKVPWGCVISISLWLPH